MVILHNRDGQIYDIEQKVVEIIAEYQNKSSVVITTNSEGICLETVGFYKILDFICATMNFDKQKVTIQTPNAEETHPEYRIHFTRNNWFERAKLFVKDAPENKNIDYWVAAFFGKPNWHRLVLATWLHDKYPDRCLQTMHYNDSSEVLRSTAGLDKLLVEAPWEIEAVSRFLSHCPLTLDEGFINPTIGEPTHYNILSLYPKFFVELVDETYVSGKSFFPTEKTLRPMMAMTPFVIMGPQGYLENLRRIGFKTFSNWWDESYDNLTMCDRVLAIKDLLSTIMGFSKNTLEQMIDDMREVLVHNRTLIGKLHGGSAVL